MNQNELKDFLDDKVAFYNRPQFIPADPISIPHMFVKKQDIEISGLLAAVLSWGQRKTIINKARELMALMDNDPYNFILGASEHEFLRFETFKHRTFNGTDMLYFLHFLQEMYSKHTSLEKVFSQGHKGISVEIALNNFYNRFISLLNFPSRTKKHIQSPEKKSACKRMNMFLRWMVRKDDCGVDFGIWEDIEVRDLICPCDLHVDKVARSLGLISRKQTDWSTAVELTDSLKHFDPEDPVKYDFALFSIGVVEKKIDPSIYPL